MSSIPRTDTAFGDGSERYPWRRSLNCFFQALDALTTAEERLHGGRIVLVEEE